MKSSNWVQTEAEIPGRPGTLPSHPMRVESLNGAPVICLGLSKDGHGTMYVVLDRGPWTGPERIRIKPGTVEDGIWCEMPDGLGWVCLPLYTLSRLIPGLSLSALPPISVKRKAS